MSYDRSKNRSQEPVNFPPLVPLCGNGVRADGTINGSKCTRQIGHPGHCVDRDTNVSWQCPPEKTEDVVVNTEKLARDIHALGVLLGSKLIAAEKLCNSGADWAGKELTILAGDINNLNGLLNGVYYAAKQLLSEDDFQQFVYRSGIDREVIESGIRSAEQNINTQP